LVARPRLGWLRPAGWVVRRKKVVVGSKRSAAELVRLVGAAMADECGLPRPGLWLCVEHVEAEGQPPSLLRVWATLHFLPIGSPFCCGEPGCHLSLWTDRLAAIGDRVRREMGLRQSVAVEFPDSIAVRYHAGVRFALPMDPDTE
jgi:hypothetical protein